MKRPRLSIARLMVLVGVIALNFAIARALFAESYVLLVEVAPIALVLELGVFRLVCGGDQTRGFWAGFVAFGAMAMLSLLWAWFTPPTGHRSTPGKTYPSSPGSAIWNLWDGYFHFAVMNLLPLPGSKMILGIGGEIPVITAVFIFLLPQLLIAVVGGLVTRLIGRVAG